VSKFYQELEPNLQEFIEKQKVFFVGTAAAEGTVNVSPKGMNSLRIVDSKQLAWLNLTGSGNETAAHLIESPRMTLMFCAFEGNPLILRVYGTARSIHSQDSEWSTWIPKFPAMPGARQIFLLDIDRVQTSCGFAVPHLQYTGDRDELRNWAEKKGEAGVKEYWKENNQISIDGKPTKIFD
jgi:predicted pyridoxine 5'-phosphate oxidase superfamily flavin-nucleotide-binding protein